MCICTDHLLWAAQQRKIQSATSGSHLSFSLSSSSTRGKPAIMSFISFKCRFHPMFRLMCLFYFSHRGGYILHLPELLSRMYLPVCLPEFHHRNHTLKMQQTFNSTSNFFSGFNSWILELFFVLLC